jgi:hypothetical protein
MDAPARTFAVTLSALAIVTIALALLFHAGDGSYIDKVRALPKDEVACRASHGTWMLYNESGHFACSIVTRDGGHHCITSRDCQGVCLAAHTSRNSTGATVCSNEVLVLGCVDEANGSRTHRMCRDG